MQEDYAILAEVDEGKKSIGVTSKKLSGSLTVEVIRRHLINHGFYVSERDVFIRGIHVEFDLLIVAPAAKPHRSLIYDPADLIAALEIKNYGVFGKEAADRVRQVFDKTTAVAANVRCCYLTLRGQKTYKHRLTKDTLGYPAFTLFWQKGSGKNTKTESTGDWRCFLDFLAKAATQGAARRGD